MLWFIKAINDFFTWNVNTSQLLLIIINCIMFHTTNYNTYSVNMPKYNFHLLLINLKNHIFNYNKRDKYECIDNLF